MKKLSPEMFLSFANPTFIITALFHVLFILTPLIFYPETTELFEFNKMLFVYGVTILITGTWIWKMINAKQFLFRRTFFDIPLLLFLTSQMLSTIFSMDQHTSFFGYYSRFHGGLLSTFSYLLLYWAFVSNISKVKPYFYTLLISGVLVSLWGIPSHFGYDPSCLIISERLTSTCWSVDFDPTVRTFSTLGQPNWLAAFLAMIIPLNIIFILIAKRIEEKGLHVVALVLNYMAFTFSYSRGGTLGILGGFGLLLPGLLLANGLAVSKVKLTFNIRQPLISLIDSISSLLITFWNGTKMVVKKQKVLLVVLLILAGVNILYGNALTKRPVEIEKRTSNQLDNEGTESGQIRLIVWKGALEIAKKHPLLGSGVETFAYAYYQFRPAEHNYVSEWDFLYNKAHNEYLNFLATTGIVGLLAYIGYIVSYFFKTVLELFRHKTQVHINLLLVALASGMTTYLIQNIVGFSVVPIGLLFFLFAALAVLLADEQNTQLHVASLNALFAKVPQSLLRLVTVVLTIVMINNVFNYWHADQLYKQGLNLQSSEPFESYDLLSRAVRRFDEPMYRNELAYSTALIAASYDLEKDDLKLQIATASSQATDVTKELKSKEENLQKVRDSYQQESLDQLLTSLKVSPLNVALWKNSLNTYIVLGRMDPTMMEHAEVTARQAKDLAPTDPRVSLSLARLLMNRGKVNEAIKELEHTVQLKNNYYDALKLLADLYVGKGEKEEAKRLYERVLQDYPEDEESLEGMKKIGS